MMYLQLMVECSKIKHLPPTITAKYNFKNSTGFTPYIGIGGTAFIAWDEETTGRCSKALSERRLWFCRSDWF